MILGKLIDDNNTCQCMLCPVYCKIKNGDTGECKALINYNGNLVSNLYGKVSSMTVESIEKKPFVDFMRGTRVLSVGLFSCNLCCCYCENNRISQEFCVPSDSNFSVQDIISIAVEKKCSSIYLTYSEPTIHFNFLIDMGTACKSHKLKLIIKTNAYVNMDAWDRICEVVDAINMDYKGPSHYFKNITRRNYMLYDYNKKIYCAVSKGVHVEISIPIMNNYGSEWYRDKYFSSLEASFTKEIKRPLHCHLVRINPAYEVINQMTTSESDILSASEDLCLFIPKEFVHV